MKIFLLSIFLITGLLAQQTVHVQVLKDNIPLSNVSVIVKNEKSFLSQTEFTESLGWARINIIPTSIKNNDDIKRNETYSLIKNYPNPFNSRTTIAVQSTDRTVAEINIYNVLGQKIRHLQINRISDQSKLFVWDGKDNTGRLMPNGVYFTAVKVNGKNHFHKLLFLQNQSYFPLFGGITKHLFNRQGEKIAAVNEETYRFVISDTSVPPRFALFDSSHIVLTDTLRFNVKELTAGILNITANPDSFELVWDWEIYHDPQAITYSGTNGKCNTFDAPPHFWKDSRENIFCIAANGVNYRVPFNDDFTPQRILTQTDIIFNSAETISADDGKYYHQGYGSGYLAGSCEEFNYDNNIWVFGMWTDDGENIYALGHHEFYPRTCPVGTTAPWINAVHYLTSDDGGTSFRPQPYTPYSQSNERNNSRLILTPQPWDATNPDYINYGFYHPSNIVREGNYYYAAVEGNFWLGTLNSSDHGLHEGGLVLIRTKQPESPLNWQVYTENGWKTVDHNTIQGRNGQEVKLFLQQSSYSPYDQYPSGGQLLSFSLVQHIDSGQWIVLGYSNQGATTVQYSLSNTLKEPDFSVIKNVENAPVLNLGRYMNLVDHRSPGYVFQYTGNGPYLYFIAPNNDSVIPQQLQNTVSDNHSRSIWRVLLIITNQQ